MSSVRAPHRRFFALRRIAGCSPRSGRGTRRSSRRSSRTTARRADWRRWGPSCGRVARASAKRLIAYVDAAAGQTLMDKPPARGTIAATVRAEGGITQWTLSNGATVVLQPTTLKEDQILFRAVAPGGTSLASDADFI